MRYLSSAGFAEKRRVKSRKRRNKRGEAPVVHYFHQVDDPYSHLAVQKLDQLRDHYSLAFQPHLVPTPNAAYRGSASHFDHWARQDARNVAADYGTTFNPIVEAPAASAVALVNARLAGKLQHGDFAQDAVNLGAMLWADASGATAHGSQIGDEAVANGAALRRALGHYQGAMFYFDGEWYWGVDRLRLLETRLHDEGFGGGNGSICVPEPTARDTRGLNAHNVVLEYFPSLRSPYTAIAHQRVLDLVERSGVKVHVRPVMPMLMRGIPAPREKQLYIITDTAREARARGVSFGNMVDPFGAPVKRAFALFPGAAALDRGMEFVSVYLTAAWQEGVDITTNKGLRQVVSRAGLTWEEIQDASANSNWEQLLDDNLQAMLQSHLWGVPSFRVSGGNTDQDFACWGQDRIWRVENEIARRVT